MTEIVRRSKAVWGYSAAFLAHFRAGLAVRRADLALGRYFLAVRGGRPVALVGCRGRLLADLFVAPEALASGIGRALLDHALADARRRGLGWLVVDSDPYAEGFYRRMGGWPVGRTPSPWPGEPSRTLPRLRLVTATRTAAGRARRVLRRGR